MKEVSGENNERDVKIYTLSTCGWCNKTKNLLQSMNVEYKYADLDELSGEEREEIEEELKEYNSAMSTPTIVIDDGEEVIIGFQEDKIKETFGNKE